MKPIQIYETNQPIHEKWKKIYEANSQFIRMEWCLQAPTQVLLRINREI